MTASKIVGAIVALLCALLLLGSCGWSGFLMFVASQGRGNDVEAVMVMQPITCVCMLPVFLVMVAGGYFALRSTPAA